MAALQTFKIPHQEFAGVRGMASSSRPVTSRPLPSNAGGSVMIKRVADLLVDTPQLVMPPSTLIAAAVIEVAVHSTRAVLQGKGSDVWEMVVENIS